jgi:hypothetical protein
MSLYNLVVEDRACPQVAAVKKEFLDYCVEEGNKKKVGSRQSDEPTAIEGSVACCNHAIFGWRGV